MTKVKQIFTDNEHYDEVLGPLGDIYYCVITNSLVEDYDSMKPYIALTDKTRKKMMQTNF